MLGLVVVAMLIGYNVYKYNSNPVVLLSQYVDNLYKWHLWSTIGGQILFAFCSLLLFIIIFTSKNSEERKHNVALWLFSIRTGLLALIGGVADILGSTLLVRALANHPTEFNQISVNLLFTVVLMYLVSAWQDIIQLNRHAPKREAS